MEYSNIKVPLDLHKRLRKIQGKWQLKEGRRVTIIEVLTSLVKEAEKKTY